MQNHLEILKALECFPSCLVKVSQHCTTKQRQNKVTPTRVFSINHLEVGALLCYDVTKEAGKN